MTKKAKVNLESYRKAPRLLGPDTEDALQPGGVLHAVLDEVIRDTALRLDIRARQLNVYYRGGSLLRLQGARSPWKADFDKQYFVGDGGAMPFCPRTIVTSDDASAWVRAFPLLRAGMDKWWSSGNRRQERDDCQKLAAGHSALKGSHDVDFLVLDIEYQWAQRRFDLMAARRRITSEDPVGWVEPDLVFVEAKSAIGPCSGRSGLGTHARDFRDIVCARDGLAMEKIRREYEGLIAQKTRMGLFDPNLGFQRFSSAKTDLLLVLIGIDKADRRLRAPLEEVRAVSDTIGDRARIQFLRLDSAEQTMRADATISVQHLMMVSE
ncbi:MAG: hypothetical protein U1E27_00450 [Kiritimatiellia bacterium]|nr:hypothetical protein [Kiritimatiellia bacterium]